MTTWITMILASALAVAAERGPDGPRGPRENGQPDISAFVDRVAEAVGATDEQVTQLKAIASEQQEAAEQARAKMEQLTDEQRTELRDLQKQLREARRQGNDEQVEKLQTQIHEITGHDAGSVMKETHDKIAAILTPDQLATFENMVKEERGPREGRGERRAGGPGEGGRFMPVMMDRFIERVAEAVNATDEQREALDKIGQEHKEAAEAARANAAESRQANREELQELHKELRDAKEDGDTEAVEMIRNKMQTLMGGGQKELMDATMAKIAAVLTEEQMPAFEAVQQEAKARLQEGAQRMRQGGRQGRGGEGKAREGKGRLRGKPAAPAPSDDDTDE